MDRRHPARPGILVRGLRVLYECGLRCLTARAHNRALSFAVSTAWQKADLVAGRPSRLGRMLSRTPVPEGSGPFGREESAAAGELEYVMERRIPAYGDASSPCRSWVAGASTVRGSVHRARILQVSRADPRGLLTEPANRTA